MAARYLVLSVLDESGLVRTVDACVAAIKYDPEYAKQFIQNESEGANPTMGPQRTRGKCLYSLRNGTTLPAGRNVWAHWCGINFYWHRGGRHVEPFTQCRQADRVSKTFPR